MPEKEQIRGKDLGLEIITKKSVGWPKDVFNLRTLTKGILQGKYKWRCTHKSYTDEEVLRFLYNNDLDIKECWRILYDQVFKKIRNGYFEEKTPPPNKDRFRKLSK